MVLKILKMTIGYTPNAAKMKISIRWTNAQHIWSMVYFTLFVIFISDWSSSDDKNLFLVMFMSGILS